MISDYYLPTKISDKFLFRFLKDTGRVGDEIVLEGFLVSIPYANIMRRALWQSFSIVCGDFDIMGVTPFPVDNFPVMPVLIPRTYRKRARVVRITGKVYDLSMFSSLSGRFLFVEKMESMSPERYFSMEHSGLGSKIIREMIRSSFDGLAGEIFTAYFLSSASYANRIGGNAISVLSANRKGYATDFSEFRHIVDELNPIFKKGKVTVTLTYEDDMQIKVDAGFKIRYTHMVSKRASKYYRVRKSMAWEKSAITEASVKAKSVIMYSDIPYFPTEKEVKIRDTGLLQEYNIDLGFYVFDKHISDPEIDEHYVENVKSKLLWKLEREFPLIVDAMNLGIIMDMGDINGFGEHAARVINAMERLRYGDPVEETVKLYLGIFERIEDVIGKKVRLKLDSMHVGSREKMLINRALMELNTLKPGGWSYDYFDKKIRERGYEKDTYKIFQRLWKEGIIIKTVEGLYKAVNNL